MVSLCNQKMDRMGEKNFNYIKNKKILLSAGCYINTKTLSEKKTADIFSNYYQVIKYSWMEPLENQKQLRLRGSCKKLRNLAYLNHLFPMHPLSSHRKTWENCNYRSISVLLSLFKVDEKSLRKKILRNKLSPY